MESVFSGEIEVQIIRSGQEVTRVVRPLRKTAHGTVIRYKKKFWLVDGTIVNLDAGPVDEGSADEREEVGEHTMDDPDNALQAAVIDAPSTDRLLVDAGPGTGKTFVACSRVAALINDGIPPGRILLISFTRTAIKEIRNRLADYLNDASDAAAVKIATIDSHAWAIQSGFSSEARLTGSFDQNIEATLQKIQADELVQEDLQRIRHLVIDEAQDVVGIRANLLLAMIDGLAENCGVTVFADRAQAIYGFTEDATRLDVGTVFLDALEGRSFTLRELLRVHRTSEPKLLELFTKTRRRVLDRNTPTETRGKNVRSDIERLASEKIGSPEELDVTQLSENTLVLLRQRFDVLEIAARHQERPYRLRMSGMPARILPWVSMIFWDFMGQRISKEKFVELWGKRAPEGFSPTCDQAWALLVETAGETANLVDIHRLRQILGRAAPPPLFTSSEYGDAGPVIGTIHASKGREADHVHLYLPAERTPRENENPDEEIRVIFVGATRAKKKLLVGNATESDSGKAEGRAWKGVAGNKVMIEVGRSHDLLASGLVGKSCFTQEEALAAQGFFISNPRAAKMFASAKESLGWNMELRSESKQRVAAFSDKLRTDLREIARITDKWPQPSYLAYVRSIGLRSLVLRPDDPDLESLHEPWRTSGFLFAPMLAGFGWSKLGVKK